MKKLIVMIWMIWAGPLFADSAGTLSVEDAYVRGLPPTQTTTAAFFRVANHGSEPVTLFAGASQAAEKLEIHRHDHHNGMMKMVFQESVEIPAGGEFVMMPGSYHLMLIGLTRPLNDGDRVQFSLQTSQGETLHVEAPVISVLHKH